MVAAAAREQVLQVGCSRCRGPSQRAKTYRQQNGCDERTPLPSFVLECCNCEGRTELPCSICEGKGRVEFFRCPSVVLAEDKNIMAFLQLVSHAEQGAFPRDGGTLAQSAQFMAAWQFLRAYESRLKELKSG